MDIRTKEAVRYLGYGNKPVDELTLQMMRESFLELERISKPKHVYYTFELSFEDDESLNIGVLRVKSKKLQTNLKDCKQAILLCATLGADVDRKIRTLEVKDMAQALVFHACAAAYLEEYCDDLQMKIEIKLQQNHFGTRPRFSPGYGDFSIMHQKQILDMLDATKQVGVTLTDSYMLVPTKSVTAVIGIIELEETSNVTG